MVLRKLRSDHYRIIKKVVNWKVEDVIYGINGPVVTVKNTRTFSMMEMVHVGTQKLVGEVIGINDKMTTIQVYEETTGLKPGDPVTGTGAPMNVLLGPGIIDNIFDGIERPLKAIEEISGSFIARGAAVSSLDLEKEWNVTIKVKVGDMLSGGQIYATCPETAIIEHRFIVPPTINGTVTKVQPNGNYKLTDTIVTIKDDKGVEHQPQEWFIVPLPVVDVIIQKIMDGSIVGYTYNPEQECLEKRIVKEKSIFDTKGMKILTLNIKKVYFDEIMSGAKKIEYRQLKQTTLNKYTYLDESDGKRYLRRYDAIRFFVGYHKDRESALVQVKDITYNAGIVEYHLGLILEVLNKN